MAVVNATAAPGRWLRAGMGGTITGLDIASCLSLPSLKQFDPEIIEELLIAIEQGALVGMHKREKEKQD